MTFTCVFAHRPRQFEYCGDVSTCMPDAASVNVTGCCNTQHHPPVYLRNVKEWQSRHRASLSHRLRPLQRWRCRCERCCVVGAGMCAWSPPVTHAQTNFCHVIDQQRRVRHGNALSMEEIYTISTGHAPICVCWLMYLRQPVSSFSIQLPAPLIHTHLHHVCTK